MTYFLVVLLTICIGILLLWQFDWLRHGKTWQEKLLADATAEIDPTQPIEKLAILFHGCSGKYDPNHQKDWGNWLRVKGFTILEIDSFTPRHISPSRARKMVCGGYMLRGQQRAKDVKAAIDYARETLALADNKIHLFGWSHGAWSVLEYLYRATPGKTIFGGLVLFYPFCSFGASYHKKALPVHATPTLLMVSEFDQVVNPAHTLDCAEKSGKNVELHLYDANHAFDVKDAPDRYIEQVDQQAKRDLARFLERI